MIDKADGVVFRSTLDGSETQRFLEIPSWMFDRAACACGGSLSAEPFVSLKAFNVLSALLDLAVKSAAPNAPVLRPSVLHNRESRALQYAMRDQIDGAGVVQDRGDQR